MTGLRGPARRKRRPLWKCPKCGARLVTRNMWHSCGEYSLEALFARSEPHVLKLFKKFAKMVRECGRVTMIPQKTRVVFMVRVRFAGVYPRKSHLLVGLGLPSRVNSTRFIKIEQYTPHFIGHMLELHNETDLDAELKGWIRKSFSVGKQQFT